MPRVTFWIQLVDDVYQALQYVRDKEVCNIILQSPKFDPVDTGAKKALDRLVDRVVEVY